MSTAAAGWNPPWLKDMTAWIANPNIPMYGRWNHAAQSEGGVDLTSKQGTPVYALADGPLIGAGTFGCVGNCPNGFSYNLSSSFGVVTQRITVPGYGLQDIYYQHINIDKSIKFCQNPLGSCNNQYIHRGQQIGTTGGFGEVEVGFNANWDGVWGINHPGAWVTDPRPLIAALMNGPVPTGTATNPFLQAASNTVASWQASNPIAPDADVATFLAGLDTALELQNPFDLDHHRPPDPPPHTYSILGNTITDPVSWAADVGTNMIQDLSALTFRVGFVIMGLVILYVVALAVTKPWRDEALHDMGEVAKVVGPIIGDAAMAAL